MGGSTLDAQPVMKVAVVDAGTNTVLLLIAESDQSGHMHILADHFAVARLGEGVDRTKAIGQPAIERLRDVLRSHKHAIEQHQVEHVCFAATSAMRDAANRDTVAEIVKKEFGFDVEVLSGGDEAQWTYRGAIAGLDLPDDKIIGVVDIGGGSTEISFGTKQRFARGVSMDIGAVRLHERALPTAPFDAASVTSATQAISEAVQAAARQLVQPDHFVAVSGTPTSLAAMHMSLDRFDPARIHGYRLAQQDIQSLLGYLLSHTPDELLEHCPVVTKGREDILPAGTLILYSIMRLLKSQEVTVSTHGLRYGLAIREFERTYGERAVIWQVQE